MFKGNAFKSNKEYLDQLICGETYSEEFESLTDQQREKSDLLMESGDLLTSGSSASPSIQNWLNYIETTSSDEANENDDSYDNNELGNEQYAKFLINLSKYLVLWTAANVSFFNAPQTASTANVESYFKTIKQAFETVFAM